MTSTPVQKPPPPPVRGLARWRSLLRMRCPRCQQGPIFKTRSLKMNDPCPVCGLIFEREPGYFLGAMYFSYFMAVAILVPLYYLARFLFPNVPGVVLPLIAVVPYLPLIPWVFRYSRVMWIYFDRSIAPSEASSHEGWNRYRETKTD